MRSNPKVKTLTSGKSTCQSGVTCNSDASRRLVSEIFSEATAIMVEYGTNTLEVDYYTWSFTGNT